RRPNMGRAETFGHALSSLPSIADHCFISSLQGGIFGRGRFGFLAFIFVLRSASHSTPGLMFMRKSGGKTAALQITPAFCAGLLVVLGVSVLSGTELARWWCPGRFRGGGGRRELRRSGPAR